MNKTAGFSRTSTAGFSQARRQVPHEVQELERLMDRWTNAPSLFASSALGLFREAARSPNAPPSTGPETAGEIVGGSAVLPAAMASALFSPVRYDTPVVAVTQTVRGVEIRLASSEVVAADHVIVAAPLSAVAGIAFDPPLPNWKSEAIQALPMGLLTKFSFLLPRPVELGSFAIDLEATRSGHLHLAHLDGSKTSMTIIMGGPTARGLMATSTETAIAFGRTIVAALVDEETARKARATVSDWDGDPYARGAYAVVNPRNSGARRLYDRAIDDRIFFAGEASDSRQPGTVGGAVLAGARAAQQIANSLKADIRSSLRQKTAFS